MTGTDRFSPTSPGPDDPAPWLPAAEEERGAEERAITLELDGKRLRKLLRRAHRAFRGDGRSSLPDGADYFAEAPDPPRKGRLLLALGLALLGGLAVSSILSDPRPASVIHLPARADMSSPAPREAAIGPGGRPELRASSARSREALPWSDSRAAVGAASPRSPAARERSRLRPRVPHHSRASRPRDTVPRRRARRHAEVRLDGRRGVYREQRAARRYAVPARPVRARGSRSVAQDDFEGNARRLLGQLR